MNATPKKKLQIIDVPKGKEIADVEAGDYLPGQEPESPPAESSEPKRLTKNELKAKATPASYPPAAVPPEAGAIVNGTESSHKAPGPKAKAPAGGDGANLALLEVAKLVESPTNPRKRFDEVKLRELADSIAKVGLLQPLVVRWSSTAGAYEIVAGARRARACKLAGVKEVDAKVVVLTDAETIEAQLVENGQREDLTPLEEADTYAALHKDHGYSAEKIAERTGKTKATVYARMKLAELCAHGRKLLEQGKMSAQVALLIARIPGEKLQRQALTEIVEGGGRWVPEGGPSFRDAAEQIGRRFVLDLKAATFDTSDEFLLAGVDQAPSIFQGACGPCPFRSGNCRDVTPEIKSADVCTSPDCFERKTKAAAAVKLAQLEAKGVKAIPKTEAKTMFAHGDQLHWNAEVVELDVPHPSDPKRRTWAQLLKKAEKQEGVEIERKALTAPSGKILEVVDRKEAEKLIRKLEGTKVAEKAQENAEEKERRKKEEAATKLRNRVGVRVLEKLADAAKKQKALPLEVLRKVAEVELDNVYGDEAIDLIGRRFGVEAVHEIKPEKLELPDLCSVITLAMMGEELTEIHGGYSDATKRTAKDLGLDLKALEKEERVALEAEEEAAKEAKKTERAEKKKSA